MTPPGYAETVRLPDLQKYLDTAIIRWREVRDSAPDEGRRIMATHYVDAFQSVRVTFCGTTLDGGDEGC